MASYDIKAPDGRAFRVNAPDGATQEEVLAYAKANMPAAPTPKAEVEDPGSIMSAVIGAGRTGDKLFQGVKQATLSTLGHEGSKQTLTDMEAQQKAADETYKPLADKNPWATGIGEVLPLLAAPMLGTGVLGAALTSAIPALLSYGSLEDRAKRGAVGAAGGAVGGALGVAAGRALNPVRNVPTGAQKAAQEAAERLGVQLRAGEKTGSRALKWAESSLNDLPFSGGMAQKAEGARTAAINAAAARSIGQKATEITPDVLAAARQQTGSTFNAILGNRSIPLDQGFRNEVSGIVGSKVMKALRDDSVEAVVAPFRNMPKGQVRVTGEWFMQNKTALDSAIRTAYNAGENGKAAALEKFEKALERAAIRSMSKDEAAAFKAAQKQWASLRILETGKVVEGGNVMPGRLDSALTTRYKAAYKEGKLTGDLADIGAIAQSFKQLPQSGTAPRMVYSALAGATAANPAVTAAMFAAPPLAQKFLQSKAGQDYFTKGLLSVTPEMEKMLIRGGGGLLGVPAAVGAGRP